jgi:hypothetical protein
LHGSAEQDAQFVSFFFGSFHLAHLSLELLLKDLPGAVHLGDDLTGMRHFGAKQFYLQGAWYRRDFLDRLNGRLGLRSVVLGLRCLRLGVDGGHLSTGRSRQARRRPLTRPSMKRGDNG